MRMTKCNKCGKEIEDNKHKRCKECREKDNKYQREYRKKRREQGLCPRCGGEIKDKYKYCERCREKRREHMNRMRKEREKKGICVSCGKEKDNDKYKHCKECRKKARKYNKKIIEERKEKGLCINCGKKMYEFKIKYSEVKKGFVTIDEDYNLCEKCREKEKKNSRKYYRENREQSIKKVIKWQKNNPDKYLFSRWKIKFKKKRPELFEEYSDKKLKEIWEAGKRLTDEVLKSGKTNKEKHKERN